MNVVDLIQKMRLREQKRMTTKKAMYDVVINKIKMCKSEDKDYDNSYNI
ncbi:hypothetical protein PN294_02145 [Romboutsia sp. 1001216sp1]|nr:MULTISPECIES: hypothetical protein [unclassified Romboutsia]MDB8800983.1 hypothetical protein [Romboutsia sp. 1001216sp1]MDB8812382.1 hypothetical protein [Romboutsia sp. 1001216sp1]